MKPDLQDALSVIGVVAVVTGLWIWNHAAAIVVFGVICLLVARRIEREKALRESRAERKS